jgi:hypothetical protein
VQAKVGALNKEFSKREKELKEKKKEGGDWKKDAAKLEEAKRAKIEASLSEDELFILDNGVSKRGFHYHGSAKFFAQIGKAFADTLVELEKRR